LRRPDGPRGDRRSPLSHRALLPIPDCPSAEREKILLQAATICRQPLRGSAHRSHPYGRLPNARLPRSQMPSDAGAVKGVRVQKTSRFGFSVEEQTAPISRSDKLLSCQRCNRGKIRGVVAGLVPAISIRMAQCPISGMAGTSPAMTQMGVQRVLPMFYSESASHRSSGRQERDGAPAQSARPFGRGSPAIAYWECSDVRHCVWRTTSTEHLAKRTTWPALEPRK